MLFSERSIWTMVHGIGFGGAALVGLGAAMFYLYAVRGRDGAVTPREASRYAALTVVTAALLWLAVIAGTYLVFPPYRIAPPQGTVDLAAYPRALILASPDTVWLHAFAMETKEHVPWIASMLATAVAAVAVMYGSMAIAVAPLRRMSMTLLAVAFALAAYASLLGVFVNKVAPLH
jgi:hypothetical protein